MSRRRSQRRGVSLLELLVVVALLGIFSSVAVARFGPQTLTDFGAQADVRRAALDLQHARRLAIKTGDNHFLQVGVDAEGRLGYQLYRRTGSGNVVQDEFRVLTDGLAFSGNASVLEFNFLGEALAAYQATLTGPDHAWRIQVVPSTGAVEVYQL